MGTANQIITDSLKLLGILEVGDAADSDQAADGLRSLNLLIDSLANERLMLFQLVERTKALTEGTGAYTIGASGDIDTTRPVRIESAWTRDANDLDCPIEIIKNQEWSLITLKSLGNTNPMYLYYRPAYPQGTIELWPLPGAGLTLYLQVWDQLTQFATLTTSASFPPGYERFLIYNLAIEEAPMYGVSVKPEVAKIARDSKTWLKTVNAKDVPIMTSPLAPGKFSINKLNSIYG